MLQAPEVVRSTSSHLELNEIVRAPVTELLGVTADAAAALTKLGIRTIFDLGTSQLFAAARVAATLNGADTVQSRFGLSTGDLLIDAAQATAIADIANLPLANLRALGAPVATLLSTALNVASIRDFALWPPQQTARQLIGQLVGATEDPEAAQSEALRPQLGQYPTERVYYTTLTMLQTQSATDKQVELTGPVSLSGVGVGFNQPAVGALLTYSQSWFAQGITLGQLLHSVALAPGEATRIAVIDWSRRTSATAEENIGETEQLDNTMNHARAVSEVQEAVASDFQSGGSKSSASSRSHSDASASAEGTGLLQGLFFNEDDSSSSQSASSRSRAESSSWSMGNRSVLASMSQNVNDLTEQHASSVRNRRASAVREVSQSEHEQVSTRVVANYNHMHALTVQYFEVVQLYRITSQLHRADRCLFVPMELLDFTGDAGIRLLERHRSALARASLSPRVTALLADDTTAVEISPTVRVRSTITRPDLQHLAQEIRDQLMVRPGRASARFGAGGTQPSAPATDAQAAPAAGPATPAAPPSPPPATSPTSGGTGAIALSLRFWDDRAVAQAAHVLARPLFRHRSDSLFAPDDTELVAISFDDVVIKNVQIDSITVPAAADQIVSVPLDVARIDIPAGVRLIDLAGIALSKADAPPQRGTMLLHCSYLGRRFTLPAIPIELSTGTAFQKVVSFQSDQADRRRELMQHLQAHREYYSRAVFRALDSATLTLVLSRFRWNGKPLIDQIEPRPVAVAGNYLVLRAPVEAEEDSGVVENKVPVKWGELIRRRGLEPGQQPDQRLVPVPTGGVFAEAVLGRSNAAEKLDITRFWNWQDSPIPLSPPEIAPVATGSRATTENLTPGQLSAPVLNVMPATPLPEPAGLSAALTALANMNFRDMSGLPGTQALTQAALAGTLDAATAAGTLASENMKTEAQKAVAMGQIAADIAKAAIGAYAGVPGGGGGKNISEQGALINHARDMDERLPVTGQQAETADTVSLPAPGSGGTSDVAASGHATPGSALSRPGREDMALNKAIFGGLGESVSAVIERVQNAVTPSTSPSTLPSSGPGSGPTVVDTLLVGIEADRARWERYAKYELRGATFRAADTLEEFIALVASYKRIVTLNVFYHGSPGAMGIDREKIDPDTGKPIIDPATGKPVIEHANVSLKSIAAKFAALPSLPKINRIDFDGCNVGDDPTELEAFGTVFGASKVSGWNQFHAMSDIAFPESLVEADIKAHAEFRHYDGYFLTDATVTRIIKDTPAGEPRVMPVEWFQRSFDASPALPPPPLTGVDGRSKTFSPRSKADIRTGSLAVIKGVLASLATEPVAPLTRIIVTIAPAP